MPSGRSLMVVSLFRSTPACGLNGSALAYANTIPDLHAPERAANRRAGSVAECAARRRRDGADRCPRAPCRRGRSSCPAASERTRCPRRRATCRKVYETRPRPHGADRVKSESVRPLNHESPSESYWLMLPKFGIGPPQIRHAQRVGLRRGQRRHVDVARHDDLRGRAGSCSRPWPTSNARSRARSRLAACSDRPSWMVGIDRRDRGEHARRKRRAAPPARRERPAGRTRAAPPGTCCRRAAARSRSRAAAADRSRRHRSRERRSYLRPARTRRRDAATRCWRRAGRAPAATADRSGGRRSRSHRAGAAIRPARTVRGSGSTGTATARQTPAETSSRSPR